MDSIVLIRNFQPPMDQQAFYAMSESAMGCLSMYRTTWHESLLSEDGRTLICCFEAPDAESVRQISRGDGAEYKSAWAGTVHDTGRPGFGNVIVERRFDEATTAEAIQEIEDAASWCLEQHKVTFLRTYFSADKKHMLCIYKAPDVESVRQSQRQAAMPVTSVFACKHYTPDNMFT